MHCFFTLSFLTATEEFVLSRTSLACGNLRSTNLRRQILSFSLKAWVALNRAKIYSPVFI